MALTKAQLREILSGAGADPEKVTDAIAKIIEGHTASIEALREERDQLKEKAESAERLQKELDDLKASSGDITKLQKEYDDYKTSVENEKVQAKKESALKQVLKELGIPERHFAKIVKYGGYIDGLEVDDDGKVKNASELAKAIKEEWSDHIETSHTEGVQTPNPQSASAGKTTKTKAEIMQIKDTSERQAALKEYLIAQSQDH